VFTAVPPECKFVTRANGEFRVEVAADLLPDDFHYSIYRPAQGSYQIIEATARIKMVAWLSGHSKGSILLEATDFRETDDTLSCQAKSDRTSLESAIN
jgi:hypothetical protein